MKNSDTQLSRTLLEGRERRVAEAQSLTLFSDVFMSVALKDTAACQHVLRILTGIPDLTVRSVRTQYRISKLYSHDAVLDILAEDGNGRLFNIELQRSSTVSHARRTRFYSSMIDSEFLQKGKTYDQMPEVYVFYISETDLWKHGKSLYHVRKCLDDSTIPYDDDIHIIYVNAAVHDGSDVAQLMHYFSTADPDDMSQGALSERVRFLKTKEGGYQIMCEISEKWFREGAEYGRAEGRLEGQREGRLEGQREGRLEGQREGARNHARQTAVELKKLGLSVDKIAAAVHFSIDTVSQWLTEPAPAANTTTP